MIINTAFSHLDIRGELQILLRVKNILKHLEECINRFPESQWNTIDCHTIARAVSVVVPTLHVKDGYLLGLDPIPGGQPGALAVKACDHSWLLTQSDSIIDVHPVGIISCSPLLICKGNTRMAWGHSLYQENSKVADRVASSKLNERSNLLATYLKESLA